jgi:hypothetical protein
VIRWFGWETELLACTRTTSANVLEVSRLRVPAAAFMPLFDRASLPSGPGLYKAAHRRRQVGPLGEPSSDPMGTVDDLAIQERALGIEHETNDHRDEAPIGELIALGLTRRDSFRRLVHAAPWRRCTHHG